MKQRPRIYYTETHKAMMWARCKVDDTLHEMGKLFDRPHTSIHTILAATDGILTCAIRPGAALECIPTGDGFGSGQALQDGRYRPEAVVEGPILDECPRLVAVG